MKTKQDWNYKAWKEGPSWGDKPATRSQFLAHAQQRVISAERLNLAFGTEGTTLKDVADGLTKHKYGWDKAMNVVEFIWAHLPYSEQKKS